MKNKVQLSCYVDRFGGPDLKGLQAMLRQHFAGLFGGIHLLPYYHPIDGSDAGFDPIDHLQVDPRLGGWRDIQALATEVDVMADVIVNHISALSPQFLDYLEKGELSQYHDLFLRLDSVFPKGAQEVDLLAIYRPVDSLPFTRFTLKNGAQRLLWTSFTPTQIDIDVQSPAGQSYLHNILHTLAENNVKMARLDAVGYAIKKAGGSCFMMPETFAFIAEFSAKARALDIEVLVEVHAFYETQIRIAKQVDWVYDFALPPLVLHAFSFKTAGPLTRWIALRPNNAINVLDTHDGIGIIDIGPSHAGQGAQPGLVPQHELDELALRIHRNSHGQSLAATGAAAANIDASQINCSFYDAMARNDRHYLLARALQFFLPGIPQIYYVGLLAGENDMAQLQATRVGRDINRQRFSAREVAAAIQKPIVQKLIALIRLRNQHAAFAGVFTLSESTDTVIALRWDNAGEWTELRVDFSTGSGELRYSEQGSVLEQPL